MSVVIKIVNYIKSREFKHRAFQAFLEDIDANYRDLLYHAEVRWLSLGRVLQRSVDLKNEISKFIEHEAKEFLELEDETWNDDLFFFCDITTHLNGLNVQLQDNQRFVFEIFAAVKTFKLQIKLFKTQLLKGEMSHFSTCAQHKKIQTKLIC